MGSPPAEGIGTLFILLSFGLSTIPVCTEMILNTGVNISDNKIVQKKSYNHTKRNKHMGTYFN